MANLPENPDEINFFPTDFKNQPASGKIQQRRNYMSTPSAPVNLPPAATSYEDEPPLLEELGINFLHIYHKTLAVLNPLKPIVDANIMDDSDMAGPIVFCILLGGFLLLKGKVQFGYIFGVGTIGCVGIYLLLNLLGEKAVDLYHTIGVLGYCLLPMIILAFFSLTFPIQGFIGYILAGLTITWCTYAAASMFVKGLGLKEQQYLVMYPVVLVYTCFALLTIF